MDERFRSLARTLVGHSTGIKKGDLVILTTTTAIPYDMNRAVIEAVQAAGGELLQPMLLDPRLVAMARHASSERSLKAEATGLMAQFLAADVHIILRGARNPYEQSGVPSEKATLVDRIVNGLTLSERLDHSRWVLTNWPTESFAQLLGRSLDETEDLYFRAVLADYRAMQRAVQPLAALMRRTKKVRITGPGTDLTFSIDGIPVRVILMIAMPEGLHKEYLQYLATACRHFQKAEFRERLLACASADELWDALRSGAE